MRFVGFDPSGAKHFGWCVIEGATRPLSLIQSGCVSGAAAAVEAVVQVVGDLSRIDGVGIDGPLFWTPSGGRHVDSLVRGAIKALRALNAGGTVPHVNSLRGACITQAVVAAYLLRRALPAVRITEAHPKALLWLLKDVSASLRLPDARIRQLARFVTVVKTKSFSEHERDAALGAIAAWAMITGVTVWRNIALEEQRIIRPIPSVEYSMPIGPQFTCNS